MWAANWYSMQKMSSISYRGPRTITECTLKPPGPRRDHRHGEPQWAHSISCPHNSFILEVGELSPGPLQMEWSYQPSFEILCLQIPSSVWSSKSLSQMPVPALWSKWNWEAELFNQLALSANSHLNQLPQPLEKSLPSGTVMIAHLPNLE